ncbi:hypothetical protein [Kitasatospora sp. NPDC059571]|uniref:hypothetical protein n=1 Tax=Kitasatospora sp. NPDC059571 TaxID=3346871 RepID=UPI0036C4C0FA
MPTSGFTAGIVDEYGMPAWISGLASRDPNHTVHVIRGLRPTVALLLLGARPNQVTPCELPAARPTDWTSLARAAIGPTDSAAVLLSGRVGDWTFVYDDGGLTCYGPGFEPPARALSVAGGVAATSTVSLHGDTDLVYAVDGELKFFVTREFDPARDGARIPAGLRDAVDAAGGTAGGDGARGGERDGAINMRILSNLANLRGTVDDLRGIQLWAAPLN